MRSRQRFEFAYRLVVAVEFSIRKSEAHPAIARSRPTTGIETLSGEEQRSTIRKLFRRVKALELETPAWVALRNVIGY